MPFATELPDGVIGRGTAAVVALLLNRKVNSLFRRACSTGMTFDRSDARATHMTVQQKLQSKSAALLLSIESRLSRIMTIWFGIALAACALRIATSPIHVRAGSVDLSCPMCCWSERR